MQVHAPRPLTPPFGSSFFGGIGRAARKGYDYLPMRGSALADYDRTEKTRHGGGIKERRRGTVANLRLGLDSPHDIYQSKDGPAYHGRWYAPSRVLFLVLIPPMVNP